MDFIMSKKGDGCIFCTKPREQNDRENYILARGTHCFVILNAYPYNNGHLMVVPYAHVATLEQLDAATCAEMMELTKRCVAVLRRTMTPDGFNIGANIGSAAGAGIADHVHLHVVPRWVGDTNFMPVIGDTRLLPELLRSTYDRLQAGGLT